MEGLQVEGLQVATPWRGCVSGQGHSGWIKQRHGSTCWPPPANEVPPHEVIP